MNRLAGADILDIPSLRKADIELVLETARAFEARLATESLIPLLRGRVLTTLFYEPSTRTRLSFEAAMLKLGGNVLSVSDTSASSVAKGESLADTARTVAQYCDVLVIRHPQPGSAREAADAADIPVINAGDGSHNHPTQALLDLYTLLKECGKLDGLKIALVGDLKYGRTTHSLAQALVHYHVELLLVSPPELRMPAWVTELLAQSGVPFREAQSLPEAMAEADVVYMTRIQRERFSNPAQYERLKGTYVLTPELMAQAPRRPIILHPLPRVDEISPAVDGFKEAAYFRQVRNGLYVRMALLALVLGAISGAKEVLG